ncbi:MAG: site-specific integrase [Deltaproteobacteria bacterium]|nr:site-specific integrase [Deltaproteobacteria bacterium]
MAEGKKGKAFKRMKTSYPGVFYIEGTSLATGKPEKIFYIRYRKAGKMIEEKAGRQSQDMTPARANQIRAERIQGKSPSRKEARETAAEIKWTVDRLWQEYVHDKPATKGWSTDRYRYEKYLKASLGNKEPHSIVQMDVHRLRINLSKTLAPQTVKHLLRLLARIINFGLKKGLCPGLKFKIEMPRVNNLRTEDLSVEQLTDLLKAIDQEPDVQAANFMRLALCTGMRRGEIFKLQWQDVDFERNFLHIRQPKGGKDVTIPLNQMARELLESHPRSDSPHVFPGRAGKQRTRYPKRIDAIRDKAGLPPDFRPLHGLRHFFASQLASSGEVNMHVLQQLLGHKSASMTARYSHLRDQALRQASNLAGDLLNQAMNGNQAKIVNLKGEE